MIYTNQIFKNIVTMEIYTSDMIQRISDAETNISDIYLPSKDLTIATLSDKVYGTNLIESVKIYPLDENNVKIVEIVTSDIYGRKIKIIQRVRVTTTIQRRNKYIERRRKTFKRFGVCSNQIGIEPGITMTGDDINIMVTFNKKDSNSNTATPKTRLVCRNCGMVDQHFTMKCPNKISKILSKEEDTTVPPITNKNKYVPPHLKHKTNSETDGVEGNRRNRENNIKLSNFSEDVTEDDLYELICKSVCDPKRVFIVKDKKTQKSKGYAYISFYNKQDTNKALEVLNGKGFNYCILQATTTN